MAPSGLDGRNSLDPAAVDGRATSGLDGLGQGGGGDRTEEAAVGAGGGADGHYVLGQPDAGALGVLQGLDGAAAARLS